ncbi:uncharacterized protein FOMMEDRAFT_168484 [Fomitiporia mediterranea MF3/22]|uniref:uncharacterized protein n=1 Tax=Fomitiporia mediterranea (strain MF3/22) TaxID=694068 RepID=UPI000440883F|nr:uncharacterized protein FOMMEDRAFT_168484 [Fomitiporia mediterranea MF3/22]EJD01887.1 hypothetical protein FOMMEDRAFT_168484 [Fomitiporia mediterranea MF3/22]
MSFLTGTLSGALVAGGVYYGFSNLIKSQTEAHRTDMRVLAHTLTAPPRVPGPPPAAERVAQRPMRSLLERRWNEQVEGIFKTFWRWEKDAMGVGRKWLYGSPASS